MGALGTVSTLPFHCGLAFDDQGNVVGNGGHHYLLSMVLGITSARGNSIREVTEGFRRAAAADGMRRKAVLVEANVRTGQAYAIEAYFDAATAELYQFQIWTDGPVTIEVDGVALPKVTAKGWTFRPVALAQGKHHMVARGVAGEKQELAIRFGAAGAREIGKRCHKWDIEHVSLHFSYVGSQFASKASTTNQVAGTL